MTMTMLPFFHQRCPGRLFRQGACLFIFLVWGLFMPFRFYSMDDYLSIRKDGENTSNNQTNSSSNNIWKTAEQQPAATPPELVCNETRVSKVYFTHYPQEHPLWSKVVRPYNPAHFNDTLTTSNKAVCVYTGGGLSPTHFAHTMQAIYPCWCYWHAYPHLQPVLTFPQRWIHNFIGAHILPFNRGFMQTLEKLGVQIGRTEMNVTANAVTPILANQQYGHYGSSPEAYHAMRDKFVNVLNITTAENDEGGNEEKSRSPRVAVFSRNETSFRSILNADYIAYKLRQELSLDYNVPVVFFEGASFRDQVKFFANVDILVSPHGAQLSSIPFMPDCAMVMELLPPTVLYPSFFGSLSALSGVNHSFMQTLEPNQKEAPDTYNPNAFPHMNKRIAGRAVNYCPDTERIVRAVEMMQQQWHTCRQTTQ